MSSSQEIDIVIKAKDEASRTIAKLQGNLGSFAWVAKGMAGMVVAGFAAITASVNAGRQALEADEAATYRLTKLLETASHASRAQTEELLAQADALEATTVASKEMVMTTQSQLATFNMSADSIKALTPSIIDYVVAEKGAAAGADEFRQMTNGLAQALNWNFKSLTASGFVLDANTRAMIKNGTEAQKTAAIIGVLDSTYKWFAAGATQTAIGKQIMFNKTLEDFNKSVAGKVLPALYDMRDSLVKFYLDNKGSIEKVVDGILIFYRSLFGAFKWVISTIYDVYTQFLVSILGNTAKTTKGQADMWRKLFVGIANAAVVVGTAVSLLISGLSAWISILWNSVQVVAQGIVSAILLFVSRAFEPIQYLINEVIGAINFVRTAIGKTALDTVHFSENMASAAIDSMKETAVQSGKDISTALEASSKSMGKSIGNAITSIEGNFEWLNATADTTGMTLGGLFGGMATGAQDASKAVKWQGEAMKDMKEKAEDAIKKVMDRYKDLKGDISELKKKIGESTEEWKKFRTEGMRALADVNAEIIKLKREAGDINFKINSDTNNALAERNVEILKEQAQLTQEMQNAQRNGDLSTEMEAKTKLLALDKEQLLIKNGVSQAQLDSAVAYDKMSASEKIILEAQKQRTAELDANSQKMQEAIEKQQILEAQTQQKKIGHATVYSSIVDGLLTASIELENGKRQEIHGAENIALAAEIANKQAAYKQDYDTLTKQLATKLKAQESNLKTTAELYKQFNNFLKVDTQATADSMIASFNSVTEALRSLLTMRSKAGFESLAGARADGWPVTGGSPYLVGENGPEIIIPKESGTVIPNSNIWGNQTNNVTINITGGSYKSEEDKRQLQKDIENWLVRSLQKYRLGIS